MALTELMYENTVCYSRFNRESPTPPTEATEPAPDKPEKQTHRPAQTTLFSPVLARLGRLVCRPLISAVSACLGWGCTRGRTYN